MGGVCILRMTQQLKKRGVPFIKWRKSGMVLLRPLIKLQKSGGFAPGPTQWRCPSN